MDSLNAWYDAIKFLSKTTEADVPIRDRAQRASQGVDTLSGIVC
jgi:hypothetical protein